MRLDLQRIPYRWFQLSAAAANSSIFACFSCLVTHSSQYEKPPAYHPTSRPVSTDPAFSSAGLLVWWRSSKQFRGGCRPIKHPPFQPISSRQTCRMPIIRQDSLQVPEAMRLVLSDCLCALIRNIPYAFTKHMLIRFVMDNVAQRQGLEHERHGHTSDVP